MKVALINCESPHALKTIQTPRRSRTAGSGIPRHCLDIDRVSLPATLNTEQNPGPAGLPGAAPRPGQTHRGSTEVTLADENVARRGDSPLPYLSGARTTRSSPVPQTPASNGKADGSAVLLPASGTYRHLGQRPPRPDYRGRSMASAMQESNGPPLTAGSLTTSCGTAPPTTRPSCESCRFRSLYVLSTNFLLLFLYMTLSLPGAFGSC